MRAFVCKDGDAEDAFEATLTATAKALVEAVAQADVACESQGGTESAGCAMGESTIRATAKATVRPALEHHLRSMGLSGSACSIQRRAPLAVI